MGNRANIRVRDGDDEVYLYTHWNGDKLPGILRSALVRGRDRWDDAQYLARIIFCEMVKDDVLGLTGYGITATTWDGGDSVIEVDPEKQVVVFKGDEISFLGYIAAPTHKELLVQARDLELDLWADEAYLRTDMHRLWLKAETLFEEVLDLYDLEYWNPGEPWATRDCGTDSEVKIPLTSLNTDNYYSEDETERARNWNWNLSQALYQARVNLRHALDILEDDGQYLLGVNDG